MNKNLFLFFLLLFLLIPLIEGSGVACYSNPVEIDFSPNLVHQEKYTCWGAEKLGFSMNGPLEEYARVINITKQPKGQFEIIIEVRLPEKMPRPGPWLMMVSAADETPVDGEIAVRTSMAHYFTINVPYPGKYVDATFKIRDVENNETAEAILDITSRGEETIDDLTWELFVENEINETVFSNLGTFNSLGAKQKRTEKINFKVKDILPGRHTARVLLKYGEDMVELEDVFKIGSKEVVLKGFTEILPPGEINHYYIYLEAGFREEEMTFVEIYVNDSLVGTTPSINLGRFGIKTFKTYVDLRNYGEGEYPVTIKVFFGNKVNEFSKILLLEPPPVEEEPTSFNGVILIVVGISVVILVGAIVALIILVIKHR